MIDLKSEHSEGGHNMNLDSDLGETRFTNLINYAQEQLRRAEQDVDMQKVVRAARELFRAVKKLDELRKQQAFEIS